MALVLIEGFDHYASTTEGYKGWAGPSGVAFQAGRVAPPGYINQSAEVIINNGISKVISPSISGGYVVGFAFKLDVPAVADRVLCTIGSSVIGITAGGLLYFIVAGSGTLRGNGVTVIFPNTWNQVELKVTTTTAELHLNGGAEIAATSGSYTVGASSIGFQWQQLGGTSMLVDDVFVCDLLGGHNDTFLGDAHVDTLYPIADGFYHDWTTKTGVDHWAMVDEAQIDDDTTYNFTSTINAKDTYDLQNLPSGMSSVLGAQLNLGVRKNETATRQIKGIVREAGANNFGPTNTVNAGYQFWSWLMDTDPAGGNWTVSEINNDEFGIELVT